MVCYHQVRTFEHQSSDNLTIKVPKLTYLKAQSSQKRTTPVWSLLHGDDVNDKDDADADDDELTPVEGRAAQACPHLF